MRSIVGAALLLPLQACAAGAGRGGQIEYDVITRDELEASHYETVYDAVMARRPNWTTPRGTDSIQDPSAVVVYLDHNRYGGVASLKEIHSFTVNEVRHFNGPEATARWGIGHAGGVIQVTTFSRRRPGTDSSGAAPQATAPARLLPPFADATRDATHAIPGTGPGATLAQLAVRQFFLGAIHARW
jgi:hypothetical protein